MTLHIYGLQVFPDRTLKNNFKNISLLQYRELSLDTTVFSKQPINTKSKQPFYRYNIG